MWMSDFTDPWWHRCHLQFAVMMQYKAALWWFIPLQSVCTFIKHVLTELVGFYTLDLYWFIHSFLLNQSCVLHVGNSFFSSIGLTLFMKGDEEELLCNGSGPPPTALVRLEFLTDHYTCPLYSPSATPGTPPTTTTLGFPCPQLLPPRPLINTVILMGTECWPPMKAPRTLASGSSIKGCEPFTCDAAPLLQPLPLTLHCLFAYPPVPTAALLWCACVAL